MGSGCCRAVAIAGPSCSNIKPGAGLYDITGLSTYYTGQALTPPLVNLKDGNSEQADAATAFNDNGTGTTTKRAETEQPRAAGGKG